MITLENIWQHYGVRPVLKNISMEIRSGELVAILGPNGMGKSTLMGVMAGVLSPQKGFVEIDGKRRRTTTKNELAIRKKVVCVPDHPWLPTNRTGREFILGLARLYDIDEERLMHHSEQLLELFDLKNQADWHIGSYSNGQQHKVALCGALLCETPVILLDEAFSGGLDPAGILALKSLLRHRVEQKNATVVITTPVAELVEEISDRIAIVQDGTMLAFDSAAALREQAGGSKSLADALQHIMSPDTNNKLEQYLQENRP